MSLCTDWSDEEDSILEEVYPKAGPGATRLVLASRSYKRSYNAVRCRARILGLERVGRAPKPETEDCCNQPAAASPEVLNRPLTPTNIEIIHWYAARGCSPRKTARDINRPLEVAERVLREMPPPPGRDNRWPPSHAGWGLA